MIRLGMSESTLLFFYYLDNCKINNNLYKNDQHQLINWLYTTSGFYDKNVNGQYFNFDSNHIKSTLVYNTYFSNLMNIVKNTNYELSINFHNIIPELLDYKVQFLKYINYYNKTIHYDLLSFVKNQNVLIINPLGKLYKQQYDNGITLGMNSLKYINNGYSFFNNGIHNNILETLESIYIQINNTEFDRAIISAGAYSSFMANHIINLKKEVYIIGGNLPFYFNIKTKRVIDKFPGQINETFIIVPEDMKPHNFKLIEDGCYW